ncbi:hypothetical protein [Nocardia thraciensis]
MEFVGGHLGRAVNSGRVAPAAQLAQFVVFGYVTSPFRITRRLPDPRPAIPLAFRE